MSKELKQKEWITKENFAWHLLTTYARKYAKFMNPHQTIVIKCDGIELLSGEKDEPFEVVD